MPSPPVPVAPSDRSDRAQELARLLGRVALGDRAAFEALYRATSAHLFGVVLRIVKNQGRAEELLQDVYVAVWRSAGSYDAARAQPSTWLTTVARHRAIDALRRDRTDVPTVSLTPIDDDAPDALEALPSDDAGPLELLLRAADRHDLGRCLDRLSARQQQSIALAFYQGLSHAEVAAHLAEPLGSVKSWIRRALASLADCLDRVATGGPPRAAKAD